MNELQLPYKVKHYLDLGAERIDRDTAGKLHAARERALARAPVAFSRLGLAGLGQVSFDMVWPALRSAAALLIVALGVAGTSYWNSLEQASEYEEVDAALLSDDLPIDAYLDRGFDAWIERSSPR
jgi:Protein of unknown function (DUF3619)